MAIPNSRIPRMIGRFLRFTVSLFIFSVCMLVIWRMCSSGDPDAVKRMMANEKTRAAYQTYGSKLTLQYQNNPTITRGEHNAGYFSVTQYVFIPEAEQVQLVFRYNNSTLVHLKEDYNLPEVPPKEGKYFDVTVVKTTDLTPDDPTDNEDPAKLAVTRYQPSDCIRETTSLYTYYRYIFDGVLVEEDTVGVFTDIYYDQDIDYNRDAYGILLLYTRERPWIDYHLTAADKRILEGKE